MTIDKTIRELIDRAELSAETAADLETYLAEFEAGTLHPDDEAYIEALHARLIGGGTGGPKPAAKRSRTRPAPGDAQDETAGQDGGDGGIDWRARAEAAEAELAALREAPPPVPAGGDAALALTELRARLAEALHPDKGDYAEAEAAVRAEVLREVWAVLDEVEAGAAGEPSA